MGWGAWSLNDTHSNIVYRPTTLFGWAINCDLLSNGIANNHTSTETVRASTMREERAPFSIMSDEPMLNIKAVSNATGIDPVTLRAWERRYGVPDPQRADQGYRLYSERDVAILKWLKAKTDAGVTIKRAIAMLNSQNPQSYVEATVDTKIVTVALPGASLAELRVALIDTARQFDTTRAQQLIRQAFVLYPLEDVCLKLLLPSLHMIGHLWEQGEISLQVEHFATHLARQQLLAFGATMPPPWRDHRVLAGCAPNDWHEIGVLMLSLFLRRRGWEVVYLGQAVGLERLEEAIATIRPEVILLTSGYLSTSVSLLDAALLVDGLRDEGQAPWFFYGGTLFDKAPRLAHRLPGVYAGPSLLDGLNQVDGALAGTAHPILNNYRSPTTAAVLAYDALQKIALTLTDGLTGLLLDADTDLTISAAQELAKHQIEALLAAVRFEDPHLLLSDANPAKYAFSNYKIEPEQVSELISYYLDEQILSYLTLYLAKI